MAQDVDPQVQAMIEAAKKERAARRAAREEEQARLEREGQILMPSETEEPLGTWHEMYGDGGSGQVWAGREGAPPPQ